MTKLGWCGLGSVALVASLWAAGCGGSSSTEKSCTEICSEAQAKQCTTITGDCGTFCKSLDAVASKGGCGSQESAYESCLSDNVCGPCTTQEDAFETCAGTYCEAHTSDTDCSTVEQGLGITP